MNLALIGQEVSEIFENGRFQRSLKIVDRRRWNNARAWVYTISSPCESGGSGELHVIDKSLKIHQPCVFCSMTSLATERAQF